MQKYIKNWYARKLFNEESEKTNQKTWYLPRHPVFIEHKPLKIWTVFDAAGMHDGMSMNKALLIGPDLRTTWLVLCYDSEIIKLQ